MGTVHTTVLVNNRENTQLSMLRLIAALGLAACAMASIPASTTCGAGEYNKDILEDDKSIRPLENGKLCLTLHRQNMTDKIGWKDCTASVTADQSGRSRPTRTRPVALLTCSRFERTVLIRSVTSLTCASPSSTRAPRAEKVS